MLYFLQIRLIVIIAYFTVTAHSSDFYFSLNFDGQHPVSFFQLSKFK